MKTDMTDTLKKYIVAIGQPIVTEKKMRALFKYDIATQNWSFIQLDEAPVDGSTFWTNKVPDALTRD